MQCLSHQRPVVEHLVDLLTLDVTFRHNDLDTFQELSEGHSARSRNNGRHSQSLTLDHISIVPARIAILYPQFHFAQRCYKMTLYNTHDLWATFLTSEPTCWPLGDLLKEVLTYISQNCHDRTRSKRRVWFPGCAATEIDRQVPATWPPPERPQL